MDKVLQLNAISAWLDFGTQNYAALEKHGSEVYNYFVKNPIEILKLDDSLLIGKVFQACLGFQESDEDFQEVRAENAFICFSQALKLNKINIHDEACARLMLLLIRDKRHLIGKVEQSCRNELANPYDVLDVWGFDEPADMPMSTDTKMLFTAYYLYNSIIDKANVKNEFVNDAEKTTYENVKKHILINCIQLQNTSPERKIELGNIVFDKICKKLKDDVIKYSEYLKSKY